MSKYGSAEGLLYAAFERGQSALHGANAIDMMNWKDMQALYKEIITLAKKGQKPFHTIVIDTVDIAVEMAEAYIVEMAGEKSINAGTLSYGK